MRTHYFAWLLLLFFSGCASYSSSFQKIERLLIQNKPKEALMVLEQHPSTGADKLLYLLDKAMLQRMNGLYAESNISFEEAKKHIESIQGTSLVEQVGSIAINDSQMSYEGEDYEQAFIHIYEALNYIALGQLDEARVEALQVDLLLKKKASDENSYTEHAFSRYLMGMIYEAEGELDNALIAYRKAYQAYAKHENKLHVSAPYYLKQDLLRLSHELGLMDEFKRYKKDFNLDGNNPNSGSLNKELGEVILLVHTGLAPVKRSQSLFINTHEGVPVRISMPIYQSRPTLISYAELNLGEISKRTVLAEDIDAQAKVSLESQKGKMMARLIARAIAKHAISDTAERRSGEVAGLLVNVVALATETADTRSWLTLPKAVYLLRMPVQPGVYAASLRLFGTHGQLLEEIKLGNLDIKAREKLFLERTYVGYPVPDTKPIVLSDKHEEEGVAHDDREGSDEDEPEEAELKDREAEADKSSKPDSNEDGE